MAKSQSGESRSKSAGKAATASDAEIFKILREEHAEVLALFKQVPKAAGGDGEALMDLLNTIRNELLSHARAEEREFYSALQEHDETRAAAVRSIEEHDEIEALLDELESMDVDSEEWMDVFTELRSTVERHIEEEEGELFVVARELLSKSELEDMAERYREEKDSQLEELEDESALPEGLEDEDEEEISAP